MGWIITLVTLLLKYGPAIYELVKAGVDLIKWLKKNDRTTELRGGANVELQLKDAVRHFKETRDDRMIRQLVGQLRERKMSVERFQKPPR